MRTILTALVMCLAAVTADAASPLQGRWEITMPSNPAFSGEIIVDAEGRATFSGAVLNSSWIGRGRGYVSRFSEKAVEFTLTTGETVDRIRCAVQSDGVLNCDDVGASRGVSAQYYMRRIGAGPASLLR